MADIEAFKAAVRSVLIGETPAGTKVSTSLPNNPTLPFVTFQVRGGPGAWSNWSEGETVRLQTLCWEYTEGLADRLHTAVREVLLPDSDRINGFHEAVTVTIEGQQRTVNFSGVFMNAAPNPYVDPPTGYRVVECYWLVNYY